MLKIITAIKNKHESEYSYFEWCFLVALWVSTMISFISPFAVIVGACVTGNRLLWFLLVPCVCLIVFTCATMNYLEG